jgi:phenylpyruvate tautomerase PptA (4-oxalocrotonate tautomerase family)
MSVTQQEARRSEPQREDPPCYEIHIRTRLTDETKTADLAARISEILAHLDEVDKTATTISPESVPVYATVICQDGAEKAAQYLAERKAIT